MTESTGGEGLRQAGRSISRLAIGEAANKLTRFGATVLLARTLTLGEFGVVNVGIALSGILLTLTTLGLPEYGAREVAVAPDQARRVAGLVLFSRMGALLLVSILALIGTVIFVPSETSLVALAVLMTLGLSGSADWLLRGREQMGDLAGATALGGTVVLLGCATVVLLLPTSTAALVVFSIGEGAAAIGTWQRAKAGKLQLPSFQEVKRVVRATWPLGASGLIIYASYANLDSIVLAALRSDAEAGLYSAPYRMFLAANAVILFAAYSLLPMFARSHHLGQPKERRHLLIRAFLPLAGYGLLVLGMTELLGGTLLTAVFGSEFSETKSVLIILCMSMPLYAIGYPAGYSLIGEKRNWHFFIGGTIAGGLNFLFMGLLIPTYGVDGAAIATTVGLVGGGVAWLALSGSLRPSIVLFVTLVLSSLLGIPAATSTTLAIPIGMLTTAGGLSMILVPILRDRYGT